MNAIEQNLASWEAGLMTSIPVGGLFSRNPTAYKWKACFRVWMIREAVLWRAVDLLRQSYVLYQNGHCLGARILLRSAYETVATLIYLNQTMSHVVDGKLNFHLFSDKTARLLLGSKNSQGGPVSINILTVLEKCDKRYPGILQMYADLSESAHPSWEGLCWGYSKVDHVEYQSNFSNRWMELYGDRQLGAMDLCMELLHHEYADVWAGLVVTLENWVSANDAILEATKADPLPSA